MLGHIPGGCRSHRGRSAVILFLLPPSRQHMLLICTVQHEVLAMAALCQARPAPWSLFLRASRASLTSAACEVTYGMLTTPHMIWVLCRKGGLHRLLHHQRAALWAEVRRQGRQPARCLALAQGAVAPCVLGFYIQSRAHDETWVLTPSLQLLWHLQIEVKGLHRVLVHSCMLTMMASDIMCVAINRQQRARNGPQPARSCRTAWHPQQCPRSAASRSSSRSTCWRTWRSSPKPSWCGVHATLQCQHGLAAQLTDTWLPAIAQTSQDSWATPATA